MGKEICKVRRETSIYKLALLEISDTRLPTNHLDIVEVVYLIAKGFQPPFSPMNQDQDKDAAIENAEEQAASAGISTRPFFQIWNGH